MALSRIEQAKQIAADTNLTIAEALAVIAINPMDSGRITPLPAFPATEPVMSDEYGDETDPDLPAYEDNELDADDIAALNDQNAAIVIADKDDSELISELRTVLADSFHSYYRAHSAHWNVKGASFGAMHEFFGEIYEDLFDSVDPIAEELLKLDEDAPCCLSDLAEYGSFTPECNESNDPITLATELLGMIESLLVSLDRAFECANEHNYQGCANLLADRIDAARKWRWQLRSTINGGM